MNGGAPSSWSARAATNSPTGRGSFVQFLDFECEGCLAAFPGVEELRTKSGNRVTFVVRHMPLHNNSMNAALASEATANQGKFEPMSKPLFETVGEWGHKEGLPGGVLRGPGPRPRSGHESVLR
ncbi:DsbA family protein [Gordonia iterans]